MDIGDTRLQSVALLIVLVAIASIGFVSATGHSPFQVEDDQRNTTSSSPGDNYYPPRAAAFVGEDIRIKNGGPQHTFNLTALDGTLIDNAAGNSSLSTSGITPNRYIIWNESAEKRIDIDVLGTGSDVSGRIGPAQGLSLTNPSVQLYYWLNGSKIPQSSNIYNTTVDESWDPTEAVYHLNTSTGKYWAGVATDNHGTNVQASRGMPTMDLETGQMLPGIGTPRVNDFTLKQRSNVSGQVINTSTGNPVVKDVVVKIKRHDRSPAGMMRIPYISAPPIKTDWANNNGYYNFTNLPPGDYSLEIENISHARVNSHAFVPDVGIANNETPANRTQNLQITPNTGNVTGAFVGEDSPDIRYAIGIMNESRDPPVMHMKPDIAPGQTFTVASIPEGTYNAMAAKFTGFDTGSPSVQIEPMDMITITAGGSTDVGEIGFPPQVFLTGNVTRKDTGEPINGVQVSVENQTTGEFSQTTTSGGGFYNITVSNDTVYDLRARPPSNSSLRVNTTNVTVEAPYSTTADITLAEGKTLDGWVKADGQPVDADLFLWNDSEQTYRNVQTGTNGTTGYFNITGLQPTEYGLHVYPRSPAYSPNKTSVDLTGGDKTTTIDVSSEQYNLTINVTDADTGENVSARVKLRSFGADIHRTNSTNGQLQHTGLPGNIHYGIEVRPNDTAYSRERTSVHLTSNKTVDIQVESLQGINGYVLDDSDSPVSGAWIYAYNFSERSFDSARTDSNGAYQLDIKPRDHTIAVYPPPDAGLTTNRTTITENTVQNSDQVNISLGSGASLHGNLTDAATGKQIDVDGWIGVWNRSAQSYGWAELNNGSYSIDGLQSVGHNVRINVHDSAYQGNTTKIEAGELGQYDLNLSSNKDGRILLITVKDEEGTLLEDATVYTRSQEVQTDSNGVADLSRQPAEKELRIYIQKDGYKAISDTITTKSKNVTFAGSTETREYQNESYTLQNIQGSQFDVNVNISDSNGEPISDATVVFSNNATNISVGDSAVTDSEGEAVIEGLIEGDYLVTVAVNADNHESATINGLATGVTSTIGLGDKIDLTYEVSE